MTSKKQSKRILHFCPDDKFIDMAVKQFETCAPGIHEYVIYNRKSAEDVKYVKGLDRFLFAPVDSEQYKKVLNNCREGTYAAVIMHSLSSRPWELVKAMRGCGKVAVITWGHEIYGFINNQDYMRKTYKVMQKYFKEGWVLWIKKRLLSMRIALSADTPLILERYLRAFLQVDYICPVIDEDYYEFASKFSKHQLPDMLPFSYALDIESMRRLNIKKINDDYILVGNSATPTCNHFDVFDRLKQLGVSNTVFVPLNYGISEYGALVRREGQKLFRDKFISLDIFLDFEEYLFRLSHCRYVVMGHLRQQAVGNIILSLLMGAKVFFYKRNPFYRFLLKHGAHVFSLDESTLHDFSVELDQASIKKNREIVDYIWGWKSVLKKTRNVIESLYPDCIIND